MKRHTTVSTIKRWLFLGRGEERFELPMRAEAPVRRALIRAANGDDARAEIQSVLKLLVALETRLGSPTAAARLRSWMRATPEILPLIRALGFGGARGLDQTRAFRRREGRELALSAPRYGDEAPAGTIPLKRILEGRRRRTGR